MAAASPSSSFSCRTHCAKALLAAVLFFMILQYTINVFYHSPPPMGIPIPEAAATATAAHGPPEERRPSSSPSSLTVNQTHSRGIAYQQEPYGSTASTALNAADTTAASDTTAAALEVTGVSENATTTGSSSRSSLATVLPPCPMVPPNLVGPLKVMREAPSMEELDKLNPNLELGGHFRPKECQSQHKVAIIIPYRDRVEHLRIFLHNMHAMLQRQQVDYGIYVIEQTGTSTFNRAMLMNIGFVEALKQYDYQCFIFHDVDLIPEDDRNLYTCPEDHPRHMSVAIDKFRYRLPYADLFGGVSALSKDQFEKVNGFSNMFWGWGGEDDDMSNRIRSAGYKISRYPANVARYMMLGHDQAKANPRRYEYLYSGKNRFKTDGINSLEYERVDFLLKRLYTWVYVKLPEHS